MMTSPPSGSSPGAASSPSAAFGKLHEKVRRWIWEQRWTDLRDVQEAAVDPILGGSEDVILAAQTASGKTEAAFLPIVSMLVGKSEGSVRVLYVSPLKALINDQFERLDRLCENLEIPVHRWHGDVDGGRKKKLLAEPSGILLITPESLEARFVIHGLKVGKVFSGLGHVVIDELHSFIGSERGRQLQSLLHRVELVLRRRVPRIGLSATLGDMAMASEFLRPGRGEAVRVIEAAGEAQELKLQVRGYVAADPMPKVVGEEPSESEEPTGDEIAIVEHLFKTLRGTSNLVFANSRNRVERYADLLARLCERERVPNEFYPHHGNLSKELREDVERILKEGGRPATAVCTSTLELGIDIGRVTSIAQVGTPPSVASLRQRLGRSGRRGEPGILRGYVREREITPRTPPQDRLRAELVQTIAMVQLLLARWNEPPRVGALHLSTLVQQLLSLISQYGGVQALEAWRALCVSGPFKGVNQGAFAELLRALGEHDVLVQTSDGSLTLGLTGERIVGHYSFYAVFMTPDEYRLVHGGRTLGSLPIDYPLTVGAFLIFAGRRWKVVSVDAESLVIDLVPAPGGRAPLFGGGRALVHDRVREEMVRVYGSSEVPPYLDTTARRLLIEARGNFAALGLDKSRIVSSGSDTLLFPWMGDLAMHTIRILLEGRGLEVSHDGIALQVMGKSPREMREILEPLEASDPPSGIVMAEGVKNRLREKYDSLLPADLLAATYASGHLDPKGARRAMGRLLAESVS